MFWMIFGAAAGAASKDARPGAENAITAFAFGMLAYISVMLLQLRRQRDKSRERKLKE